MTEPRGIPNAEQVSKLLVYVTNVAYDASWKLEGPVFAGRNSVVFYAECPAFPTPVAVKLFWQPFTTIPDPVMAELQYNALHRVYSGMSIDAGFSVPQPYLLNIESALLIIEWIPGKRMTESLFSWTCSRAQARALMEKAGGWLRRFHQTHELPSGSLDLEDKLPELKSWAKWEIARDPVFSRALDVLYKCADAAARPQLSKSWIHGDFKTDNLLIRGQRIYGIDCHLIHENSVVYDLAPFLNHLELSCCHPKGWRIAFDRKRLAAHFLHEYLGQENANIEIPLCWVRLFLLLSAWDESEQRTRSVLTRVVLQHCYSRAVGRLASQLERHA